MSSLGSKPSEWEAAVAADANCLASSSSAKMVQKILSTAGSRAPQKHLCAAVQAHIGTMILNDSGCDILSSLVRFGTKQSVAKLVPEILKVVNPKEMSKSVSDLLRHATHRSGCSEEADKALMKIVKVLLADPSLPNALRAIPVVASEDAKYIKSVSFKKAFTSSSKADRLVFIQTVVGSKRGHVDSTDSLWSTMKSVGTFEEEACEVSNVGGSLADAVATYLIDEKKIAAWPALTASCIRNASDAFSAKIVALVFESAEKHASVFGAIQARYPEKAFETPSHSAVATQWSRAHHSAFYRTRETVNARISQKRAREDPEEF